MLMMLLYLVDTSKNELPIPCNPADLPQVVAHVVRVLGQVNGLHCKAAQPLTPVNALHVSHKGRSWTGNSCLLVYMTKQQ